MLLADTPGVHLHHRVPHMLTPEQLRLLHPRSRLAPVVPRTPRELALAAFGHVTAMDKVGPATGTLLGPLGGSHPLPLLPTFE